VCVKVLACFMDLPALSCMFNLHERLRNKNHFLNICLNQLCTIYLQSFLLIPVVISELYPGQSSKCKKWATSVNSRIKQGRVTVLLQCISTQWNADTYKVSCSNLLIIQSSRWAGGRERAVQPSGQPGDTTPDRPEPRAPATVATTAAAATATAPLTGTRKSCILKVLAGTGKSCFLRFYLKSIL